MKVNNKEYQIKEGELIIGVGELQDFTPYGWSIEYRMPGGSWWTYWTNTIYSSKQSALNAIIQIPKSTREEYRVIPLFKMEGSALREYRIKEVLGETKPRKKLSDIKAWKSKKDFEYPVGLSKPNIIKRGSVFIEMENGTIIKSGQTEKTKYYWRSDLRYQLNDRELFDEIELKDEKWLYPHLLTELKNKINYE